MSQENVELVRRGAEAFNRRDMGGLAELSHEDLEFVHRLGVPDTRREAVANAVLPRPRRSPRSRRPLGVGRSPSPPLLAEHQPREDGEVDCETRPIAKTSGWCSRSHSPISKEADDMDRTDRRFRASASHAYDPPPIWSGAAPRWVASCS